LVSVVIRLHQRQSMTVVERNFGSVGYFLLCDCDITQHTCLDVLAAGYVCHFMLVTDSRLSTKLVCAGR